MIPGLTPALFAGGGGSSPYTDLHALTDAPGASLSGDLFELVSNGVTQAALPWVGPLRTSGKWQWEFEIDMTAPNALVGGGVYVPAENGLPENSLAAWNDGTAFNINGGGQNGVFPPTSQSKGRMIVAINLDVNPGVIQITGSDRFLASRTFQRRAAGHGPMAFINSQGMASGWRGSVRFIGLRDELRNGLLAGYQPWDL